MSEFFTIVHIGLMIVTGLTLLIQMYDKFRKMQLARRRDEYNLAERHERHLYSIRQSGIVNKEASPPVSLTDVDNKDMLEIVTHLATDMTK